MIVPIPGPIKDPLSGPGWYGQKNPKSTQDKDLVPMVKRPMI
jgi:hypothetical protein